LPSRIDAIYRRLGFRPIAHRMSLADRGDLVRITGRVCQTSYEAEGATRYGVDMIADGFAILAKASGKLTDDHAGE
jgi:single-strand DNA-binding protein